MYSPNSCQTIQRIQHTQERSNGVIAQQNVPTPATPTQPLPVNSQLVALLLSGQHSARQTGQTLLQVVLSDRKDQLLSPTHFLNHAHLIPGVYSLSLKHVGKVFHDVRTSESSELLEVHLETMGGTWNRKGRGGEGRG